MSNDMSAFGFCALSPASERLRRLAGRLGQGAVARRIRSLLWRIAIFGQDGPFDVEPFPGQRARLYPSENLSDKRVFVAPELWDRAERAALARALRAAPEPAYFVDAGANAGLYTLALRAATADHRLQVLAIEPDRENLSRLRFNLRASCAEEDVTVAPVALSDSAGTLCLTASAGNRGEIRAGVAGTTVPARPLLELVREAGFPRIDALKIDIEGMELPVLASYFDKAPRVLWPGTLVLEAHAGEEPPALAHLLGLGYGIRERTRLNAVLVTPARGAAEIGVTGDAHGNQA